MSMAPKNPVAAATHPNPYAYYTRLLTEQPLYRDEGAGYWVATSAAAVSAVLTSDLCRVRPNGEEVPNALVGSDAAEIFRRLVRMNDGSRHDPMKKAVAQTLHNVDTSRLARLSALHSKHLIDSLEPQIHLHHLTDFVFHLPVYVVASLLGIPQAKLAQTVHWINDFARCLAPLSNPEQIEQGKEAASHLLNLFKATMENTRSEADIGLLSMLTAEASMVGHPEGENVVANGIGLLFQTYEATAGLIGNTLLLLARNETLFRQVQAERELVRPLIREVLRYDSPIQNTRRYLAASGSVAGRTMHESDMVLVVLAAANRDPAVNAHPEQFDIFRKDARLFTFGLGSHACPGEHIASSIACIGIEHLLNSGFHVSSLSQTVSYRPSGNARIPLLTGETI